MEKTPVNRKNVEQKLVITISSHSFSPPGVLVNYLSVTFLYLPSPYMQDIRDQAVPDVGIGVACTSALGE